MVVVGRVTKDAAVKTLKDERKVVNFSIAVNDAYKDKKTEKWVATPTFFSCSYWISTEIAKRLKKGNLVELNGRVSINAWKDMQGEAYASLNYHVDSIKIHDGAKKEETPAMPTSQGDANDSPF